MSNSTRQTVTSDLPDRPVTNPQDDHLGRADFAERLASLIIAAPQGSTLRIGVYGEWGEGKTSVLQLMDRRFRESGHVCVWVVPWMVESRQDIAVLLTNEIATALEIDLSALKSANRWRRAKSVAKELADADIRAKVADAVFGVGIEQIIGERIKRATDVLLKQIDSRLGERILVVFVDDLDRVWPDILPNLLLTLREALDRPNYFYVLGLAPNVIERGLRIVHEAWGEPKQFLEKIVEVPCYLPPIDGSARKNFVAHLISESKGIHSDALQDISMYLPANPRKVKLFLRYIISMTAITRRFRTDQFDWSAFYLLQLLKMEFPEESRKVLGNEEVLKDLESGWVREGLTRSRSASHGDAANKKRVEESLIGYDHPERQRFLDLCNAIRERGLLAWGRYGLRALISVPDDVSALTHAEVLEIANAWLDFTVC